MNIARNNKGNELTKTVKVAGFMFLFSFIVPTLNWVFILSKFIAKENFAATAQNILNNQLLFRIGISIELLMSIGLIILATALYKILKSVNRQLALFALLMKVAEATIASTIVLISLTALQMLNGAAYLTAFTPEQLQIPLGLILDSHTSLYAIPMFFLGIDMMVFSYLFFKSEYIPGLLACFGFISFTLILIHALMVVIVPEFASIQICQLIFWTPSGLFELLIGGWFLSKGLNMSSAGVN